MMNGYSMAAWLGPTPSVAGDNCPIPRVATRAGSASPRQVALSMSFEKEPVDEQWLIIRHRQATLPAPTKPRAVF
jgi:hypothetical protein